MRSRGPTANIDFLKRGLQQLLFFFTTVAASGYIVEINGGCYRTNNVRVLVGLSSMFMNVLVSIVKPRSVSGTGQSIVSSFAGSASVVPYNNWCTRRG